MKTRMIMFAILALVGSNGTHQDPARAPESKLDCVPYNPSALRLIDEGSSGWLISRDGGARFMQLDTKEDASTMLAVFKAHSSFCYVGRNNKRAQRDRYVYHYWK